MRILRAILISVALLVAFTAAILAQTSGSRPDVLSQLLAEVRELRLVMQRQGADGARIQLLISRLTIQETRVSRLARDLDQVREELARLPDEQRQWADQMKQLEAAMTSLANAEERTNAEIQLKFMRRQGEEFKGREQRLRARESDLDASLGTEQARWIEISNRLDELERSLGKSQ